MNGDLISRKALLKFFQSDSGTVLEDAIIGIIEEQKNAFDVDKVVAKLKEKVEYETGEDGCVIEEYIRLNDVLNIIKSALNQ